MGTNRNFSTMLNEYLTIDLLKGEWLQRDYFFTTVEKDLNWTGGPIPVPFKGQQASSVKFGGLTSEADIAEYKYIRGQVTSMPEVWGTLKFHDRDLREHNGKVNEKSFLKILPDQIEEFMDYLKMVVSINLMSGAWFAKATANGTALGVLEVNRIDRFELDQKVVLLSGAVAQADYYVIAIDINDSKVTLSATRGGAAADISTYLLADGTKCYHDGVLVGGVVTNSFTSLKSALLTAANGGTSTLYGVNKLANPYTQAINVDGAATTASNILEKLFDAYTEVRSKARGNANTFLMSYKHLGSAMKLIETQKGSFKTTATSTTANEFGWTMIEITSVKGTLKLVGIQEADDDVIMMLDWKAMQFYSNGLFQIRTDPDSGEKYYSVRTTSGYYYLVDICLFGELILKKPANCGIIFGISY